MEVLFPESQIASLKKEASISSLRVKIFVECNKVSSILLEDGWNSLYFQRRLRDIARAHPADIKLKFQELKDVFRPSQSRRVENSVSEVESNTVFEQLAGLEKLVQKMAFL